MGPLQPTLPHRANLSGRSVFDAQKFSFRPFWCKSKCSPKMGRHKQKKRSCMGDLGPNASRQAISMGRIGVCGPKTLCRHDFCATPCISTMGRCTPEGVSVWVIWVRTLPTKPFVLVQWVCVAQKCLRRLVLVENKVTRQWVAVAPNGSPRLLDLGQMRPRSRDAWVEWGCGACCGGNKRLRSMGRKWSSMGVGVCGWLQDLCAGAMEKLPDSMSVRHLSLNNSSFPRETDGPSS